MTEPINDHFVFCHVCGERIDLRDLAQVAEHMHDNIGEVQFYSARRVGDPEEFPRSGGKIDLN